MNLLPVRWERPAIHVFVPHVPDERTCHAAECMATSVAHVIWLEQGGAVLRTEIACQAHLLAFRTAGIPHASCPLGTLPPLETVVALVNQELARRRPPPQMFFSNSNVYTSTGTIPFGNITFNVWSS